jgi:hypothetical protein
MLHRLIEGSSFNTAVADAGFCGRRPSCVPMRFATSSSPTFSHKRDLSPATMLLHLGATMIRGNAGLEMFLLQG